MEAVCVGLRLLAIPDYLEEEGTKIWVLDLNDNNIADLDLGLLLSLFPKLKIVKVENQKVPFNCDKV